MPDAQDAAPHHRSATEVFLAFLRLGCTSFGGPVAHLGYFRTEFVQRRRWLTEPAFAEMIALAQSLPGPASSQTGYMIGLQRAGLAGGLAAWLGFTLPSAALMLAFAFGHSIFARPLGQAMVRGLQLVAVAVVAQAVLAMQRSLAPDAPRLAFAAVAAAIVFFSPAALGAPIAIAAGALAGGLIFRAQGTSHLDGLDCGMTRRTGVCAAILLAAILLTAFAVPDKSINALSVFARFTRAGALVFGGGHVVLPLLEGSIVARGWVGQPAFLAGYGAAQAVPGPLFTFAAYLGAAIQPSTQPLLFGIIALLSIFAPGLLLVTAILPFWTVARSRPSVRNALGGVNAGVVGILFAALLRPVASTTLHTWQDAAAALAALLLLTAARLPPWAVVLAAVAVSCLVTMLR
jgi:chromate transporter